MVSIGKPGNLGEMYRARYAAYLMSSRIIEVA
jgi:hypothetical protein